MNAKRRKALAAVIKKLETLDNLQEEIREELQEVMDEEQDALDNMPDSLKETERGETMQENVDNMEAVIGELNLIDVEDLTDQLQQIIDG